MGGSPSKLGRDIKNGFKGIGKQVVNAGKSIENSGKALGKCKLGDVKCAANGMGNLAVSGAKLAVAVSPAGVAYGGVNAASGGKLNKVTSQVGKAVIGVDPQEFGRGGIQGFGKTLGKAGYRLSGAETLATAGKALGKCKPSDAKCIALNLAKVGSVATMYVPGAGQAAGLAMRVGQTAVKSAVQTALVKKINVERAKTKENQARAKVQAIQRAPVMPPPQIEDVSQPMDMSQPINLGQPMDGGDAGQPDSGPVDAGQPDAGQPDGGDAGQPDAGQPDAGQPDAGQPDGGDAGQPDAVQPMDGGDAGQADTGDGGGVEGYCSYGGAGASLSRWITPLTVATTTRGPNIGGYERYAAPSISDQMKEMDLAITNPPKNIKDLKARFPLYSRNFNPITKQIFDQFITAIEQYKEDKVRNDAAKARWAARKARVDMAGGGGGGGGGLSSKKNQDLLKAKTELAQAEEDSRRAQVELAQAQDSQAAAEKQTGDAALVLAQQTVAEEALGLQKDAASKNPEVAAEVQKTILTGKVPTEPTILGIPRNYAIGGGVAILVMIIIAILMMNR